MLSPEENEILTRVGPGTPCGELLRRYCRPIAARVELTEKNRIIEFATLHSGPDEGGRSVEMLEKKVI